MLFRSKGDHWDWLIQKAVEIGIDQITPLLTAHSVVKMPEREHERKRERWRQIAISALKQSGQAFLPLIDGPVAVSDFCRQDRPGARWILSERGGTALRTVLKPDLEGVTLLVGPEGGWSDAELEVALRHGYHPVTLGPQTFRAEMAPLYALAVIRFVTGD